jgi:hypothetical protein
MQGDPADGLGGTAGVLHRQVGRRVVLGNSIRRASVHLGRQTKQFRGNFYAMTFRQAWMCITCEKSTRFFSPRLRLPKVMLANWALAGGELCKSSRVAPDDWHAELVAETTS